MHERTQRAIARMTFVFCCAIPTFATLVIIAVTWTPWWHRQALTEIESRLSDECGLDLRIDDFHRESPSSVTLDGVEIYDPETGREVARVRQVRWARRGDRVSVLLQQPELRSAELPHTWKMLHERFLCRPERTKMPIQLAANDLTIHSRTGALTLRDVDAWIRPGLADHTVEATIECLPAGTPYASGRGGDSPLSITVVRDRGGASPTTSWVLSTGQTPLPCSALAEYLPELAQLGNDATFGGTMRWLIRRNGWTIDLGGSWFSDIELGTWCEQLPHRLTGRAEIHLERCRLTRQSGATELVDIAGSLRGRNGLVGASLLRSARDHLGFAIVEGLPDSVAYDRLALGFNLHGPLLHLEGICRTEHGLEGLHSGVVLLAGGQSLAESAGQTLQATQLQAAIAPRHSVMVPVSRQTSPLMQLLIPPSRPTIPIGAGGVPRITTTRSLQGEATIEQPGVDTSRR